MHRIEVLNQLSWCFRDQKLWYNL